MPKWKLIIEYEGTRYRGWQEQINARTVQGELRKAAVACLGREIEIAGSGRTDAGVHALHQVAHIRCSVPARAVSLRQGLNDRLPADINVRSLEEVPARFHARHHAEERFYLYQIATERSAFGKHFVWWIKDSLDLKFMSDAARLFIGMHDFAAYKEKAEDPASTLVNVTRCEIAARDGLILLRIGASHFLWKMVRRIAGVLVEVGRGNLPLQKIDLLTPAEIARWTAPPSGLFLEYVRYPADPPPGPLSPAFTLAPARHRNNNEPRNKGRAMNPNLSSLVTELQNRAKIYVQIYRNLVKEVGQEKAVEILKRSLYARGQEKGEQLKAKIGKPDLHRLAQAFVEGNAEMDAFGHEIVEEQADQLTLRLNRCPLVDAWKHSGLSADEQKNMCDLAYQVDFGKFETAGYRLSFTCRIADRCKSCDMKVTLQPADRDKKASR
jgi:tRNA pseudouridine38-40 synthase